MFKYDIGRFDNHARFLRAFRQPVVGIHGEEGRMEKVALLPNPCARDDGQHDETVGSVAVADAEDGGFCERGFQRLVRGALL